MENEAKDIKSELKSGDVVFITMSPDDKSTIARARFVKLTKDGNAKLYVIDPKFNLVDIEVKADRIIRFEKPN